MCVFCTTHTQAFPVPHVFLSPVSLGKKKGTKIHIAILHNGVIYSNHQITEDGTRCLSYNII